MIDVEIINRHKVLHTFLLYSIFQGIFFHLIPTQLRQFCFWFVFPHHHQFHHNHNFSSVLSTYVLLLHNVYLFFIQYCSMNQSLDNLNHSSCFVLPDTILVLFSLTGGIMLSGSVFYVVFSSHFYCIFNRRSFTGAF